MSRLDDLLREALQPEDPGEDFTRRVLGALPQAPAHRPGWRERVAGWFRLPQLRWAAAVAALVVVVGGIQVEREYRLRTEGEAAKAQLMLAMRIAGVKLHAAQAKVQEMSEQR